jgi:hypothetical protein
VGHWAKFVFTNIIKPSSIKTAFCVNFLVMY